MLITRKIIKLGTAKVVTLPKEIASQVNYGDAVTFNINLVNVIKENIKTYRCKSCGHVRDIPNGDDKFCTACNCEDMEELNEETNNE